MRNRNFSSHHDGGEVDLGSTHATIRLPRQTDPVIAQILHREHDANGKVIHVVLDQVVHGRYMTDIGGWSAQGVIVTELFLGKKGIPGVSD